MVTVFAARRGLVVAAITETRDRIPSIISRFHNGQFWIHSVMWPPTDQQLYLLTKGSFGSSLGCGTRMIVPVRSFFRCAPDSACSTRLLSSSKMYVVPVLPDQFVASAELWYCCTWHMLKLSVFKYTETHVCELPSCPRITTEESGLG
jgi:hypothetical protein